MMRKFRRIFRSPSTSTTIKNETNHQMSSSDSTPDDMLHKKQGSSSVTNRLYTGRKKNHNSYICFFLVFGLIEIIHQGEFVFSLCFWDSFFSFLFEILPISNVLFVLQNNIQLVIVAYAQWGIFHSRLDQV